ncbi:MAG: DUF3737 family protein [Bacilli bacterium]|nr:DUF3737 family protein [Bacilli bacterium]
MKKISNITNDVERAFYSSKDCSFDNIKIDGPADGESAFKECSDIVIDNSFFNLRYPFWHNTRVVIKNSTMTDLCRAALWYDEDVTIKNVTSDGIKALRECKNVTMVDSTFHTEEIFWKVNNINVVNSTIQGAYAFLMSNNIKITKTHFKGKYSFQYCHNIHITDSVLDTKDAFWHSEDVLVENCDVIGEYLGWYSKRLTFKNCRISGTQPLCYASELKFIDCTFEKCDLSFEYSEVEGNIVGDIVSIKNPLKGVIKISGNAELIQDENDRSNGNFTLVK